MIIKKPKDVPSEKSIVYDMYLLPNYKRCAFQFEYVGINKLTYLPAQQPLIFDDYKFIYQPITKVACKTIKTWMLSLLKNELISDIGETEFGKRLEIKHNDNTDFNIHDYSIKIFGMIGFKKDKDLDTVNKLNNYIRAENIITIDKDQFKTTDRLKDYFKFTFVRNPWSRMVSSYMEKYRNPMGFKYKPAKIFNDTYLKLLSSSKEIKDEYFDEDNILSFKGFVDLCYQLSKKSYYNFDIHWMPQYIMNDMYIKDFDFIGKLENFEQDFNYITEKLNINFKPNYKIGSLSHTFQKHKKFYDNNPELIDKIAEIYKEDIERYGYDFSDLEK